MALRIQCLDIDAANPSAQAEFWKEVLGWRITHDDGEEVVIEPLEGSAEDGVVPDILFMRVPEGKVVKNRLHLDLRPEEQSREIARLEALGATRIDVGQREDASWVVMADPEGNEFCVLMEWGSA